MTNTDISYAIYTKRAISLESSINNMLENCFLRMNHASRDGFVEIAREHSCNADMDEYFSISKFSGKSNDYFRVIVQKLQDYETRGTIDREIMLQCFSYIIFGQEKTDKAINSINQHRWF